MVDVDKQKFEIFDASGSNYQVWNLNVKLRLGDMKLKCTVNDIKEVDPKDGANVLFLILHHLSFELRDECPQITRPFVLWKNSKTGSITT